MISTNMTQKVMQKTMQSDEGSIVPYLNIVSKSMRNMNLEKHKHRSMADFIIKFGQHFKPYIFPKKYNMGKQKQCYKNIFNLLVEDVKLIPVIGYAMSYIPLPHAWCVTENGNVIDPTWDYDRYTWGKEYFGIPFKRKFILSQYMEKEYAYNIIDDYKNNYPLMRGQFSIDKFYQKVNIERRTTPFPEEE